MTRVAIQGVSGSYSEEAVRRLFGNDASLVECEDFDRTFSALRLGDVDGAVVPVENKIVGTIRRPVELLNEGAYRVLEKLDLRVQHVLAGTPDSLFDTLVSVRSHIEALKQCKRFLAAHPNLSQIVGADTASSVRRIVSEGDPTNAAIGSRRAAELYGAKILRENIADDIDNWTTFYLIGN
jgi:prephenate dehydratase